MLRIYHKFCLVIPLPNEIHTSLQDNSRLDPIRPIVKPAVGRIVMDFEALVEQTGLPQSVEVANIRDKTSLAHPNAHGPEAYSP